MIDALNNAANGGLVLALVVGLFIAALLTVGPAVEWWLRTREEEAPEPVNRRFDPHVPMACGREGCGAVRPWQEMNWDYALGHVCPADECQATVVAATEAFPIDTVQAATFRRNEARRTFDALKRRTGGVA